MKRFLGLSQLRKKSEIIQSWSKMKKSKTVVYTMKFDMLESLLFH